MLRCEVCDFTTQEGSSYAGLPPNNQNWVQYHKEYHGTYCKHCFNSMSKALFELEEADLKHEPF